VINSTSGEMINLSLYHLVSGASTTSFWLLACDHHHYRYSSFQ